MSAKVPHVDNADMWIVGYAIQMRIALEPLRPLGSLEGAELPKDMAEKLAKELELEDENPQYWTRYLFSDEVLKWIREYANK